MTEEEAKKQFLLFAGLRLFGLALFFVGIAIAFTDWLRPGGWKLLGGILVVVGVVEAVISPRLIKRTMNRGPQE
jgi:hypothetical protein